MGQGVRRAKARRGRDTSSEVTTTTVSIEDLSGDATDSLVMSIRTEGATTTYTSLDLAVDHVVRLDFNFWSENRPPAYDELFPILEDIEETLELPDDRTLDDSGVENSSIAAAEDDVTSDTLDSISIRVDDEATEKHQSDDIDAVDAQSIRSYNSFSSLIGSIRRSLPERSPALL